MTSSDLVVVLGATASGKTSLAIKIAKKYNGEIVSADSMQIYKDMPISTAQPNDDEMQGIKYHLIGFLDPKVNFSVGQYQSMARGTIRDIQQRGKLPIVCGGTGLYIDSLIYNMDFAKASSDDTIRQEYTIYYKEHGADKLHKLLEEQSRETAARIHPNNVHRTIRALEILKLTGGNIASYYNDNMKKLYYNNLTLVGINWDRQKLYDRINHRVDIMIELGLVDEIKNILNYGVAPGNTSYKALGCKELSQYFEGEFDLATTISKIKQYTRNYAKRQITWFKRLDNISWLNYGDTGENSHNITKLFELIENIYF